jgi:hypothetical protein
VSDSAVAFVVERLVEVLLADDVLVATRFVVVALVAVTLVKMAVTALRSVEKRLVEVIPVAEALESVVWLETVKVLEVRLDAVVVARSV